MKRIDCKELSLLRLSERLLRPSVIRIQLLTSQEILFFKVTYPSKLRVISRKELSLLKLLLKFLRTSPSRLHLKFLLETFFIVKKVLRYVSNVNFTNFFHWLHRFYKDFRFFFRPSQIKFEIILSLYQRHAITFKEIASTFFTNCEYNSPSRRFTWYLRDDGHLSNKYLLNISINYLLFCFDEIFTRTRFCFLLWLNFWQHLFLFFVRSIQDKKVCWGEKYFSIFYLGLIC